VEKECVSVGVSDVYYGGGVWVECLDSGAEGHAEVECVIGGEVWEDESGLLTGDCFELYELLGGLWMCGGCVRREALRRVDWSYLQCKR
jgi:hypothetical protein